MGWHYIGVDFRIDVLLQLTALDCSPFRVNSEALRATGGRAKPGDVEAVTLFICGTGSTTVQRGEDVTYR
jgi:hypothetical protein